jgi:anti-anti-sigma factor
MSVNERSHPTAVPENALPQFELQYVIRDREQTLILTGELDMASAPELAGAVARFGMSRRTSLVLDLRKLAFIDSSGIRAILAARELCAEQGCEFMLVPGQREHVQRVFELCGLLDHLPFPSDQADESSVTR